MGYLFNLARMTSTTTGTGTITLGSAVSGCLTFALAGVQDGDVVHYGISDGANSEVGIGTYTAAGTTLSRDTVKNSTNSGNKIDLSGSEQVFICPLADDLNPRETIIGGVLHKCLWIGNWQPTLTNGCGARAQLEMGTNKNVYDYVPFDKTTEEKAYANVVMPDDYNGGAIYAKAYWAHGSGGSTFGIRWKLSATAIADDETMDVAQGTAQTMSDTGATANDLYVSPLSSAITIGGHAQEGTLVPNVLVNFNAIRDTSLSPTLDIDAYLIGMMILYPVA